MKISSITIVFFFLVFSGVSTAGNVNSLKPELIKSTLKDGNQASIAALASSLRLLIPARARHGASHDIPCTTYESVVLHFVPLFGSEKQAVIQADSAECEYSYLLILEKTPNRLWKHIRTIRFLNKLGSTQISFENISSKNNEDVVVHNNEIDYGAGILRNDLTILKVDRNNVNTIFDEPIKLVFSIPLTINGRHGNTSQSENDQYEILNAPAGNGFDLNQKVILRRQVIRDHDTEITRWWRYIWDAQFARYVGHQSGPISIHQSH